MAVEQGGFSIGFLKAAADLSAKQFYGVEVTADETVNLCDGKGGPCLGILQDKPVAGQPCNVMVLGVTKIVAGTGNLAAGAQYEIAADGTGVTVEAAKVGLGTVLIGATAGNIATVTIGIGTGATIAA